MTKIVLVKVHEGSLNSGDYCDEYFVHFDCLDFQEVSELELAELKEAVQLYNSKRSAKADKLLLVEQCDQEYAVRLLSDLRTYREKTLEQNRLAMEKAERETRAAREKREANKLKRTAKSLGVSVEDLLALRGKGG